MNKKSAILSREHQTVERTKYKSFILRAKITRVRQAEKKPKREEIRIG